MFLKINGERHYLWRAVDHEGEALESFVTKTCDKIVALKLLRKAMRKHGQPNVIIADRLRSYGAALKELGANNRQETGRWLNNKADNSHRTFRRREGAMLRFRSMRSLQKFAAVHASVYNLFIAERSLRQQHNFKQNGAAALAEWRGLGAAQRAAPLSLLILFRLRLATPFPSMTPALCSTLEARMLTKQVGQIYSLIPHTSVSISHADSHCIDRR